MPSAAPGGALGDRFGRRGALSTGLALFGIGSLAAMMSASWAQRNSDPEYQPGIPFRVYLDPVGHPFCLVLDHAMR